ncbi:MAG: hypothetical protein ACUVRA_08400 [Candidatus Bathyarchaeaceae archaeon]
MQSYDSTNVWDNGYPSGGNYWSNYSGTDLHWGSGQTETGSDGIGDTAHQIDADNIDRYPLMGPFSTFNAGTWDGMSFNVDVISNSTVSGFQFNVDQKSVSFNVTGDYGTTGFCRVTIPNDLLWVDDKWTITVGDQQITDYGIISDGDFTYIYFSYNHSTQTVTIEGNHVIPEFPSAIILPLFTILSMIAVVFTKKKRRKESSDFQNLFSNLTKRFKQHSELKSFLKLICPPFSGKRSKLRLNADILNQYLNPSMKIVYVHFLTLLVYCCNFL